MTQLDDLIEAASDDSASVASVVRRVMVVAHRLQAESVRVWADLELTGYPYDEELPEYRGPISVNVRGEWAAFGPMRDEQLVSRGQKLESKWDRLFEVTLPHSLDALQEMARKGSEWTAPWDPAAVGAWNTFIDRNEVPHMEGWGLLSANRIISSQTTLGILGVVRTAALKFALDLQAADPDAGTPNGPTIALAPVEQVVNHFTTLVYGGQANVAQGQGNVQTVTVLQGDLLSLLTAARDQGLDEHGVVDLASVATAPESERPHRAQEFLGKIRNGAYGIMIGATGELAAVEIEKLIHMFFAW